MPVSRAISLDIEAGRGHNIWELLCRAALRGVDVAARVFGLEEGEARVERSELFVSYGVSPPVPTARRNVDWAKLSELERGQLERELSARGSR